MSKSSARPSIAILGTRGIPAAYGGFETFAEEIAVRLAGRGVKVVVYCESTGANHQPPEYKGVQLSYVSARRLGPFTTIIFDLECLWHARHKFDVVYMLGYGAGIFCFIPRLFGSRVWINMDGLEWARSKWSRPAKAWLRIMESIAMWTPSKIIADAAAIRAHLAKRHWRMPPCSVIPYGAPLVNDADHAVLDEWGLKPNGYYLVVCRLEPENHVLEILEGFSAGSSDHPLIVLGDHRTNTPYVAQLLALRSDRIRFVGTVYEQSKLQALRYYCFAYFHGHSVGGTNPSLLEALGCGNVVLAHDNEFNREVSAGAALYFSRAEDIPGTLVRLENNSEEIHKMQVEAKRIIRSRYTWERITDDYLKLLYEDFPAIGRSKK